MKRTILLLTIISSSIFASNIDLYQTMPNGFNKNAANSVIKADSKNQDSTIYTIKTLSDNKKNEFI